MTIYQHIRHPRIAARRADRPVKVADFLPRGTAINRFNTKVALIITAVVGSMYCAYAFALFDLISLPEAIRGGASAIVAPMPCFSLMIWPRVASSFSTRSGSGQLGSDPALLASPPPCSPVPAARRRRPDTVRCGR